MRKKSSDLLTVIVLLSILLLVYYYRIDITKYIVRNYFIENKMSVASNQYTKGRNYLGFQQTDNYIPSNKEELKNLFFTILDKGWDEFTFYCDDAYTNYLDDIEIMNNDGTFATINNYVHPYNSYKTINISVNEYGIITIDIIKNYTDNEITAINNKMDLIMDDIINDNMSNDEKIKAFHDYIINNTVYDIEEAKLVEQNTSKNLLSYKAYNVILNGIGLCGGYTDALSIFLYRIGVDNFKITTEKHAWNALFINDRWLHIDMTWDDPTTLTNEPLLIYDYFMITTNKLKQLDQKKHNFNPDFYLEI